jgi:penicillin-binding protein 1A
MQTDGGVSPEQDEAWVLEGPTAEHLEHGVEPERPAPRRGRRALLAAGGAVGLVLLFGAFTFIFLYARTRVPAAPPLPEDTRLFDRRGQLLATLAGDENREIVPFRRIPATVRDAVVATEDADFYGHPGVDVVSTARAAVADVRSGSFSQGGSTITQQLVKNLYTGSDKTVRRKVDEALIALKLEREYSKNEILAKYLNTVYFGHGAYGVQAAARTYFDGDIEEVGLLQAAQLAGLLAAPTRWDPLEHPTAAARRRTYVLQRMADEGYISEGRARRLQHTALRTAEQRDTWADDGDAYFIDHTTSWLEDRFGSEETFSGGLRVTTTLDADWQRAAEDAVRRALPPGGPQGALVAIEPETGAIRAMVGGRDFQRSQFNLATQAERQPGSAFKTFGLVAALQAGVSPLERFDGPPRIRITRPPCGSRRSPWIVENYADEEAGTTDLFGATANSVNTIYAQVVERVGPDAVAAAAHQLGIGSTLDPVCPIVLGSEEVTPLDLTSAYATIAAGGVRREPTPVESVDSRGGTRLAALDPAGDPALDPATAAVVTKALEGVVREGTGTAADLPGRPVAGKTGTAQGYTNAWFCGYVPQLAACVWMGYPSGNRPMEGVTGGSTPAAIWREFMLAATKGMPVEDFPAADPTAFSPSTGRTPATHAARSPETSPTKVVTVVVPPPATTSSGQEEGGGPSPSPSPSPSGAGGGHKGAPTPTATTSPRDAPGGPP